MKIRIDINEAIRYMGYRQSPDGVQLGQIMKLREMLEETAEPKSVYRVFPIIFGENEITLDGCSVILKGKDIGAHLDGCTHAALICCTASAKADELIRIKEAEDISLGFMTDCLASALAEEVCNETEKELAKRLPGKFFTWRFSPGYGDLPLEAQPMIVSALEANKRAGVYCTESLMLLPRKSVTAVIGVSDKPIENKRRGCETCKMRTKCEFQKRGERCEA